MSDNGLMTRWPQAECLHENIEYGANIVRMDGAVVDVIPDTCHDCGKVFDTQTCGDPSPEGVTCSKPDGHYDMHGCGDIEWDNP